MTGKARIIAADDEPLALRRIELLLERMPDVELVATAPGGFEALRLASEHEPDIMLLDVQMADMDGLSVASRLPIERRPMVIFVTAFDKFAVPAFDLEAIDYVVKPVDFPRLRRAVERAMTRRELAATQAHWESSEPAKLWAERGGAFVPVPVDEVEWVESDRDYVRLGNSGGVYLLRRTLTEMHSRLGDEQFLRIRRSVLVRKNEIAAVRRAGNQNVLVRLHSGKEFRVGATFLKQVRAVIAGRTGAETTDDL
jgi:DNA-binding LytR/AlgR family response regulator